MSTTQMAGFSNVGGWTFSATTEPFACEVAQGQALPSPALPLCRLTDVRWRDRNHRWQRPAAWQMADKGPGRCTLCGYEADGALAVTLRCFADGPDFRLEIEATAEAGATWLAADLDARPDEHFLGLGERFNRVDQRGQVVDLLVVNGASGGLTYKPVPFYISSAGYGLLIDTGVRTLLRLATPDEPAVVSIRCNASSRHCG